MRNLLLLPLLLLTISCSSRSLEELETMEPERPSMVLEKASYLFSTEGIDPIKIQADSIVIDDKKHQALFTHVSFHQETEDGIQGSSDKVTIDTSLRDVVLEGNVRISQPSEGFSISAPSISWNNEKQLLQSGDDAVEVVFEGSNTIKGSGFRGDLAHHSYEFSRILQGEVANQ